MWTARRLWGMGALYQVFQGSRFGRPIATTPNSQDLEHFEAALVVAHAPANYTISHTIHDVAEICSAKSIQSICLAVLIMQ